MGPEGMASAGRDRLTASPRYFPASAFKATGNSPGNLRQGLSDHFPGSSPNSTSVPAHRTRSGSAVVAGPYGKGPLGDLRAHEGSGPGLRSKWPKWLMILSKLTCTQQLVGQLNTGSLLTLSGHQCNLVNQRSRASFRAAVLSARREADMPGSSPWSRGSVPHARNCRRMRIAFAHVYALAGYPAVGTIGRW
jgi:hypothetical protein